MKFMCRRTSLYLRYKPLAGHKNVRFMLVGSENFMNTLLFDKAIQGDIGREVNF